MCRWMAYSGSPILMEELLFKPSHSLFVAKLAKIRTNQRCSLLPELVLVAGRGELHVVFGH
ncbi:MAG: hypothetical protein ABI614_27385 [Planctomycetota bacterium]